MLLARLRRVARTAHLRDGRCQTTPRNEETYEDDDEHDGSGEIGFHLPDTPPVG